MDKILITPVKGSGMDPYEIEGKLTWDYFPGCGLYYYIDGRSYPEQIVTVLEEDKKHKQND